MSKIKSADRYNRKNNKLKLLENELFSARVDIAPEILIRDAIIVGIFSFVLILIILFTITNLLFDYAYYPFLIPAVFLISAVSGILVYFAIISYPKFELKNRAEKIDASMYDLIIYLHALHHSGADIYQAIRSAAKYADYYGEAAKELRQIVSDVEFCGYDAYTAINRLTETTPSDKLRTFLSEYSATFKSIGTVEDFLKDKVDEVHDECKIEQKTYLESLGVFSEIYITLFVAGPIFVVIFLMVLGMISTPNPAVLAAVVYGLLPIGTMIFILLIDSLNKNHIIKRKELPAASDYNFKNLETIPCDVCESEDFIYNAIEKYDKRKKIFRFISDPINEISKYPYLSFIFSVPIALIVLAVLYIIFIGEPVQLSTLNVSQINTLSCIAAADILILLVPFSIFYQIKKKRIDIIEESIPDFSRQLGSSIRHNMTLAKAIEMAAADGKSKIQDDILSIQRNILFGMRVSSALRSFSSRMKNLSVDRLVILVSETEHFTADISNTLYLNYREAKDSLKLKQERRSGMLIYTFIIYIAFIIFVFIQIIMSEVFLELILNTGTISISAGMISTYEFPAELYRMILMHSVLIHGFCSGLVSGIMGEGDVLAGLKHSCIMLIIGFGAYLLIKFVLPSLPFL